MNWTAFNKPKEMMTILGGRTRWVKYTYGSDFQRITKSTHDNKLIRYFGGGVMEHISENSDVFYKYYIPVGTTTLEIKYRKSTAGGNTHFSQLERHYVFKDHLGSPDVMVNDNGAVVERLSFNPWGERRTSNWAEATGEIRSKSTRGFTGHEMDDEIGLVNMNARIYDPVIGRFLSPDPLIPTATDLQSYNRYAYVRNNPLSFTDPSGFAREDHIRHARGNSSHLLRFPGNSGFLNTNTGKFYQRTSRWVSPAETGHGQGSGYWKYGVREVTDPGQKKAIAVHLQVGSEIVQNYGGLSRGNSKETRNRYRALAASELAANGRTSVYQDHLDRAYAADQIYKHLKRKGGWRKYAKIGTIALVNFAVGGALTKPLGAVGAGIAGGSVSGALSGGSPKDILIGAASGGAFGQFGINPETLASIKAVKAIAVHGVIGCAASAAGGGSCSKGAAGQVTSKLISVGVQGIDNKLLGFALTSAGGGLINGSEGAITAGLGYLYNFNAHSGDPLDVDTAGIEMCNDCVGEQVIVSASGMLVGGAVGLAGKALFRGVKYKVFTSSNSIKIGSDSGAIEPPRIFRRVFCLSHAA